MNAEVINKILDLKENECIKILSMGISKDGENINVLAYMKESYKDIYNVYIDDLALLSMQMYSVYKDEIEKALKENKDVGTIDMSIIADEKNVSVSLYLPFTQIYKDSSEELLEIGSGICYALNDKLHGLINEFIEKEDE